MAILWVNGRAIHRLSVYFTMIFTPIYVLALLISFAAQPSRAQFSALKIGGGEVCKNENI